jgi:hypothetical protein
MTRCGRLIDSISIKAAIRVRFMLERRFDLILVVLGSILLISGLTTLANALSTTAFDDTEIKNAICQLFTFQEGAFGALVMVVAGIGAIVSSAFGAYRAATSLIVVACGSYILRSLVSLFFGTFSCSSSTILTLPG